MRRLLFVLGLCLASGLAVHAQTAGQITGEVRDASGAVVPNVTITATNTGTSAERVTVTDAAGVYTIPALVPGFYTLKAVATGFKVVEHPNVELQVQQVLRQDFALEVGQTTQTVEVTGSAELLTTDSAAVGTIIEQKQIIDIPLNGRNYIYLVALSPNVSQGFSPPGQATGREGGLRANVDISVSGYRGVWNNYTLDGIENTDPDFNLYIQSPSIDALQEFKVQSGIYPAEFGWEAAQVNVSTKSGTNAYHGAVYEFLRNDFFDAKNYDFTPVEQAKSLYQQNQYGFVLGGPVVIPKLYNGRNKLFFMSNYERLKYNNTINTLYTMPPAAWFTGDLSSALPKTQLYNPYTGAAFPNNQIPSSMFDPTSVKYMPYWPKANLTTATVANNFLNPQTTTERFQQFNQRIDFNQSASSQWFGRYSWTNESTVMPSLPLSGSTIYTSSRQYMFANTHVFSPTKVNEFRFGLTTFYNVLGQQLSGVTNVNGALGLPTPLPNPAVWGIPSLLGLAGGLSGPGNGTNGPYAINDKIGQIVDNFSWVHGKHSIRFGGEVRYTVYKQYGNEYARGGFQFGGIYSDGSAYLANTSVSAASSFADFLLGALSRTDLAVTIAKTDDTASGFATYVDDTYKLTPKLTLTLGLRYEMMQPWKDLFGNTVNYFFPLGRPTAFEGPLPTQDQAVMVRNGTGKFYDNVNFRYNGVLTARDGRLGDRLETTDWNNVAPRIGIAWSPTSKWSVRAGWGVFYSQESGNSRFDLARNLSGRATSIESPTPTAPLPTLTWLNFINPNVLPVNLNAGLTWGMDPNIRTPYSMTDELYVQRQFGQNSTLEVGYTGINSRKLQNLINADPGIPCGTSVCAAGGSYTQATLRAPFPAEANGGIQYLVGNGDANYNALGVKFTQRATHDLTLLVAYTYSRALDFGSAIRGTDGDQFAENPYCIKCEYGPSAFNLDNRFVASALYELPIGRGKAVDVHNWLADALVGGWQVNAIVTDQSGQPMSPQGWDAAGQIVVPNSNRTDYVGNPNLPRGTRSINAWFNKTAFTEPLPSPTGAFGTSGRNSITGPSFQDLDFSVMKNFRITERQTLQFRWENFNFTNHPQFGTPNDMYSSGSAYTLTPPATFDTITTLANNNNATMRQMQFALKYIF
jgi:hypothetical protein